jgi:hypothetical protein
MIKPGNLKNLSYRRLHCAGHQSEPFTGKGTLNLKNKIERIPSVVSLIAKVVYGYARHGDDVMGH